MSTARQDYRFKYILLHHRALFSDIPMFLAFVPAADTEETVVHLLHLVVEFETAEKTEDPDWPMFFAKFSDLQEKAWEDDILAFFIFAYNFRSLLKRNSTNSNEHLQRLSERASVYLKRIDEHKAMLLGGFHYLQTAQWLASHDLPAAANDFRKAASLRASWFNTAENIRMEWPVMRGAARDIVELRHEAERMFPGMDLSTLNINDAMLKKAAGICADDS